MKNYHHLMVLVLLFPLAAKAGWPTFDVLLPDQIMHKVITENCPAGQGYLPQGTRFKIEDRYIPSNQTWNWTYTGTSQCQQLPTFSQGLRYLSYEQSGRYVGSTINTIYGSKKTGPLFTFTFVVPSQPKGWDCGPFAGNEPPKTIGCARDMPELK